MERVLFICDDATISRYVEEVLGQQFELNTCEDFDRALTGIKSRKFIPDLIILYSSCTLSQSFPTERDRSLALAGRQEIISVLKDREALRMPIIVLSDEADDNGLLQAETLGFGVADYISLQLTTPGILRAKLHNYLGLHFALQQGRDQLRSHHIKYDTARKEHSNSFLPQVLVVEDDPMTVEILSKQFKDLQFNNQNVCFTFVQTRDGVLESVRSDESPHLILLDIDLGQEDESGTAIFDELKENPETRHIQIAYMTSDRCLEDAANELQSGALDFIIKPVKYPALKARIICHLKWSYEHLFFDKLKTNVGIES